MADTPGKRNSGGPGASHADDDADEAPVLADLARRAMALGLSGFFFTESTIRKALGETLPREWSDFAVDQSERTRKDFIERLTFELGQSLEKVDVAAVLSELMRGRTLDISAKIRLTDGADDEEAEDAPAHTVRLRLRGDEEPD